MIDFNTDWDEPDIWSTPTHSPLTITDAQTTTTEHQSPSSSPVHTLQASSSTSVIITSPVSSNESFHPVQSDLSDLLSNPDDPGTRTPMASHPSADLESYLQSTPKVALTSSALESTPPIDQPSFSPPPLVPAVESWSTPYPQSANLGSLSTQDSFDHHPSSSMDDFDSSIGFEEFNSHAGYDGHQEPNEEDEFGEFDDGEMTADDHFGGFSVPSAFPPALRTTPIVPITLPEQFTDESLRAALGPPLEALFDNPQSHSDCSQVWLDDPSPSVHKKKPDPRPSSHAGQIPSILKSDQTQAVWRSLVDSSHRLGRPVEWKRSQIRRHHLVHLGIPVDLNDFLTPPSVPKSLTINTSCPDSNSKGKVIMHQSPAVSSPFRGPMLDRKRCEELAGLCEARLSVEDLDKLTAIRDELNLLNLQASDTLALKVQQRDRSIQDCQAYNTMISDLVLAAQKIQMASPGSTKRASSINLGSSSISNTASRWTLTRSNSNHQRQPSSTLGPGPGAAHPADPADPSSKRFSMG